MYAIHRYPLRALLVVAVTLQLTACESNGQEQSRLTTPEWQEFKTLARQYDSLQNVFEEMAKEDPSIRTDGNALQQKLGDDLQRVYAIYQSIPAKAEPALATLEELSGYGFQDLRVLKLAADATNNLDLARGVNTRLLEYVTEEDSVRTFKLELAQYNASLGDIDAAAKYATDDVLAEAEPMLRYQLFQQMASGSVENGNLDQAQTYTARALRALRSFEEQSAANLGTGEDAQQQREMQKQYFTQQYGELLAPVAYELKDSGDDGALASFLNGSREAIGDATPWTEVKAVIDRNMKTIAADRAALGVPAAAWADHEWLGSDALDLPSLKGKVVLVDFFATWCKPCIMAFKHIRDWHEKYERDGLVVVGLTTYQGRYEGTAVDKSAELAQMKDDFMPKHDITWPVGIEKDGRKTMTDYGVNGIPHVVLIDREGKVQYVKVGAADYAKTEKKIRQLLAK